MNFDTVSLRQFIQEYFSAEDLRTLLFDYFHPVFEDVTSTMPKQQQIQMLLEYCHKHDKMNDLLASLQRERPFFQPNDYAIGREMLNTAFSLATELSLPKPRNPNQIFISHAHQDTALAHRLALDLKAYGYDTWISPDDIHAGEKWAEAIERGLDESGIFLLLMTPHAVLSRWVKLEASGAIEIEQKGLLRFVPLDVADCATPLLWKQFQFVSFRGDYESDFYQLNNRLNSDRPSKRFPVDSFVHPITNKVMVRIPAGEYLFGKNNEKLYLDEFWIDKTPVTNAEYNRFLNARPDHRAPRSIVSNLFWLLGFENNNWNKRTRSYKEGKADHPVVIVSLEDARAYAEWMGGELPTEHQWEKAARGTDGKKYPWGNDWHDNYCNVASKGTTPVGQFSPQGDSQHGCVDMYGNVIEWTESKKNSHFHVVRGGSFFSNHRSTKEGLHARLGVLPQAGNLNSGFRVIVHYPHRLPTDPFLLGKKL
ncbi:MAG: SUMF1/EgtB/PvdO family nonheme iron enzyme [Ardenticatenaceae bacterium]|nr:SUMF1/EgtB/PvdO family nonheme iron enzyme [Ardenticatenaceae bacterium]